MSETFTRPNGKAYRARKPIEVVEFEDFDGQTCVAVLRTHNYEEAATLAAPFIDAHELDATNPERDWWRLVPWDTGSGYDRNWVTDTSGGIPVVLFAESTGGSA